MTCCRHGGLGYTESKAQRSFLLRGLIIDGAELRKYDQYVILHVGLVPT